MVAVAVAAAAGGDSRKGDVIAETRGRRRRSRQAGWPAGRPADRR